MSTDDVNVMRVTSMRQQQRFRTWRCIVKFDLENVLRHGTRAPRLYERVWLDPGDCDRRMDQDRDGVRHYSWSGRVVGGDWDRYTSDFEDTPTFRAGVAHWQDGVPSEELGVYERLMAQIRERGEPCDGCLTMDDVVERYAAMDSLFEQVRREARLRTQAELTYPPYREHGGIRIGIDRYGKPIFARSGYRRLSIARILELDRIPAQVHIVHRQTPRSWRRSVRAGRA